MSDNLFAKSNFEHNFVNSIDGANALKLDENYEIKDQNAQNSLIDSFESKEENQIAAEALVSKNINEDVPAGVSIESASYMENNADIKIEDRISSHNQNLHESDSEDEYTPKLFSEDQNLEANDTNENAREDNDTEQLFDQENTEDEDFEIPAFLRRQKF